MLLDEIISWNISLDVKGNCELVFNSILFKYDNKLLLLLFSIMKDNDSKYMFSLC
jgi:hypothetical protein